MRWFDWGAHYRQIVPDAVMDIEAAPATARAFRNLVGAVIRATGLNDEQVISNFTAALAQELLEEDDTLFENAQGERVPWDELDEAEQSFYENDIDADIDVYCRNFWTDNAVDWGSGPGGSLTDDDWDELM